jgi:hypothetical protein
MQARRAFTAKGMQNEYVNPRRDAPAAFLRYVNGHISRCVLVLMKKTALRASAPLSPNASKIGHLKRVAIAGNCSPFLAVEANALR